MATYYPPVGFHFRVECEMPGALKPEMSFREVSGLGMELEEETVVEGGENRFVQKLPVRAKYPDLVLKRGMIVDSVVAQWCRSAIQDMEIRPATVWVTLLNERHEPLKTYIVIGAWPKKWQVSDFNAESSELVIESLELAYQYFTVR